MAFLRDDDSDDREDCNHEHNYQDFDATFGLAWLKQDIVFRNVRHNGKVYLSPTNVAKAADFLLEAYLDNKVVFIDNRPCVDVRDLDRIVTAIEAKNKFRTIMQISSESEDQ